MDKRIETLRSFIRGGGHFRFRNTPESFGLDRLAGQFQIDGIPPVERSARMLKALLNAEAPIIIDGERIGLGFVRSTPSTKGVRCRTFPPTMRAY